MAVEKRIPERPATSLDPAVSADPVPPVGVAVTEGGHSRSTAHEARIIDPGAAAPIITRFGPAYPPAAFRGPLFETRDRVAIAMAALMMIAPLAALPLGLG